MKDKKIKGWKSQMKGRLFYPVDLFLLSMKMQQAIAMTSAATYKLIQLHLVFFNPEQNYNYCGCVFIVYIEINIWAQVINTPW